MAPYWRYRLARHLFLAILCWLLVVFFYWLTPPPDFRHRLSMATAYVALIFLGWTLALGPWNLLRRHANPVSFDFRRDVGIWSGLLALLHTGVGLTVHLRGRMWMYFIKKLHPLTLQNNPFGLANDIGLVAALLFLGLLFISNDRSLRTLGLRRWKTLQRFTYLALALTFAHGWLFQAVEKRKPGWVAVFLSMAVLTGLIQLAGLCKHRLSGRQRSLAERS